MIEFKLKTEYIELTQLLKATGISETGGHAKLMVEDGIVFVNGNQESRKRAKLRPGDVIKVSGETIIIKKPLK
jgi:ribosome-associated protein